MKLIDFDKLQVGDTVFFIQSGYVKVKNIRDGYYPIELSSGNTLTEDGKLFTAHEHPSLFPTAKDASEYFAAIPDPLPNYPVDTKMLVRQDGPWRKRYLSHFKRVGSDVVAVCFDYGRTSWSSEGTVLSYWDEWKLADESED